MEYLWPAVDKHGHTVDFLLTARREGGIDKSGANAAGIKAYNMEAGTAIETRQCKYPNASKLGLASMAASQTAPGAMAPSRPKRVVRPLQREGLAPEDAPQDPLAEDAPLLAACYGGAVTQQLALGPDRGRKVVRLGLGLSAAGERVARTGTLGARLDAFDLNAAIAVGANQRARLEHLVRYCARGPFGSQRLEALDDGRYLWRLKRPWSDGTEALRFDPIELMERIAALIPPPRHNLVRYHGVLAPNANLRAKAVLHGRPEAKDTATAGQGGSRGQRERWAELVQRTFGLDVLACDRCGGRFELIATITDPRVARRILQHLKLPDWPPSQAPPRDPPPFWSSVA